MVASDGLTTIMSGLEVTGDQLYERVLHISISLMASIKSHKNNRM